MTYWCESCGEEIERVKFYFDSLREEIYLSCPLCGGECREKEEPQGKSDIE